MTKIDSINNLIKNISDNGQELLLEELDISANLLNNINGIENITSLKKLSVTSNNLTEIQLDNINDIFEVYNEEYDSWTNLIYIGSEYLQNKIEDLTIHFKVGDRIYYFDEIMEMSSNYSLRSTGASTYALADIEEDNGWEIVGEEVIIGDFRFIGAGGISGENPLDMPVSKSFAQRKFSLVR